MGIRTLRATVLEFLEWCKPRRSKITIDLHRRYLFRFCDRTSIVDLRAVTRIDIENFDVRKHPLESLKCFFRWCVETKKCLEVDPSKGIPVPESGCRTRTFKRREAVMMRRLTKRDLRQYLLAVEETGARPQEMRLATMAHVHNVQDEDVTDDDLRRGRCYFRFDEFKGRSRRKEKKVIRIIPISPRLGRAIARLRRGGIDEGGVIFARRCGGSWTNDTVQRRIRRLRRRVGKRLKINPRSIVCYTYRHSLATTLAVNGVTGRLLAEILGHATERMLQRYIHPSTQQMLKVFRDGTSTEVGRAAARAKRRKPKLPSEVNVTDLAEGKGAGSQFDSPPL